MYHRHIKIGKRELVETIYIVNVQTQLKAALFRNLLKKNNKPKEWKSSRSINSYRGNVPIISD